MRKEELTALAKELNACEDLSKRKDDLAFLKREWRRLQNREAESYFEKVLTDEFFAAYDELAKKENSLTISSFDEKKQLIEAARALLREENNKKVLKEISEIERAFKSAGRCSKEQDDLLFQEFKEARAEINKKVNKFYDDLRSDLASKKSQKEALIEEAKKTLEMKNIKDATAKFDELLDAWKSVGFAGKDCDEDLWKAFSEVRKEFSTKRNKYFEDLRKEFTVRAEKKEELIKRVKKFVADCDFSESEQKQIAQFRKEWKDIGFAGKDAEDELWEKFNAAIKQYYDEKKFYTF